MLSFGKRMAARKAALQSSKSFKMLSKVWPNALAAADADVC